MPRTPDRALRREIAKLALRDPADVAVILADLDPAQRLRVQTLLGDYLAPPRGSRSSSDAFAGVGPWVLDRVEGRITGVTPAAQALLGQCASRVAGAEERPAATSPAGLVDRGFAALARARRMR